MNPEVLRPPPQSSKRYFVPLENQPEPFRVPADLQARFEYDANRKGLSFAGWMCKATYDRLRKVSSEYHYQRALERLFQIAVPEDPSPEPKRAWGVWAIVGALLLAVAAVCGILLKHP
jgi:hypothetical protein